MSISFPLISHILQDGSKLLSGCNDKQLRVFDLGGKLTEPECTLEGQQSAIKCAVWGRDPHSVVSCAEDTELR